MARVLMTNLISSISGRFGGGVFRNWKGLTVLSALPDSVANPQTPRQVLQRTILAYCSKQWSTLSGSDKGKWRAVAEYLSELAGNHENEVGSRSVIRPPRGPYTPIGAMVSVHNLLNSIDAWDPSLPLTAPDTSYRGPVAPTNIGVSGNTAGVTITWTDPSEWGTGSHGGHVRVWIMSENGTFHAQLAGHVAGGVETLTITHASTGALELVEMEVGELLCQVDAVNDIGYRSAPGPLASFFVAAAP